MSDEDAEWLRAEFGDPATYGFSWTPRPGDRERLLHIATRLDAMQPVAVEPVDWPTEGGWWWVSANWQWSLLSAVIVKDGELWAAGRDHPFTRQQFEAAFGPAKFIKCEPNPFTPTTGE